MYGKHFASMYTGSMFGAGVHVFAVWGYAIAHAKNGVVELHPTYLSAVLGCNENDVKKAIDYLCREDQKSRNSTHQGRRLIKDGQFQFSIPTHEIYRNILNEDERKAYFRRKKQEERLRSKHVKEHVKDKPGLSKMSNNVTHTEAEAEAEAKKILPSNGKDSDIPFKKFWDLYSKKVDKRKSEMKWQRLSTKDRAAAMSHVPKYVESTPDVAFRKNPMTYLNGRCWEDESLPQTQKKTGPAAGPGLNYAN